MPIIMCDHLTKRYGGVQALADLSFAVESSGCIGFLGPNGAGKTTTLRILTGLAKPTAGRATINGYDVVHQQEQVLRQIGYLPQAPAFYNDMTGEEIMLWVASLFRMERGAARAQTESLLKRLGLWEHRRRRVGGYSGGMKQRLGFATALVNRPKVLLLDEPVSALDPAGRHELLNLIEELKGETTIFMSTHVLGDMERVCDRVIIVKEGRVAVEATMTELRDQYASPIFTVAVHPNDPDLTETLQRLPYIEGVTREAHQYRIVARNLGVARRELPQAILHTGATLVRYGSEEPTLEEIFLKVVGS
jgi:ABC-2 type transport system ATP-binding protein